MSGLLSGLDVKSLDHPASRVEGAPAETSAAQEEPTLAGAQAVDLFCRDVLRPVLFKANPNPNLPESKGRTFEELERSQLGDSMAPI